jgi:sulfite reductase alpha subunit-like flavoprotein
MFWLFGFVVAVVVIFCVKLLFPNNSKPSTNENVRVSANTNSAINTTTAESTTAIYEAPANDDAICVVYGSQKGKAKAFATQLVKDAKELGVEVDFSLDCFIFLTPRPC